MNQNRFAFFSIFLLIALCFIGIGRAIAGDQYTQQVEIPSSPNPVGSGARALGMGGAFISIADDATAASWNPGALIQLELPEISFVGAAFNRSEDNNFGYNPESSGNQSVTKYSPNYFSAAFPFNALGRNMIISLNYQYLFDFTREWKFQRKLKEDLIKQNETVDYKQDGMLTATGIAGCIQVTPQISLGVTFNFWNNGWDQTINQKGSGIFFDRWLFTTDYHSYNKFSLSGFNANLGVLWNINSNITLGAVYKTPFNADVEHKYIFNAVTRFKDVPDADSTTSAYYVKDEKLQIPMAYGIGLAYKFSDNLTTALDIYRTEWGDFLYTDYQGNETSPISGKSIKNSNIKATHQVRLGTEYRFHDKSKDYVIPLRGGIFYDPSPAEGNPDDYYGVSIGTGFIKKGLFALDIAYQYRFGNNVASSMLEGWKFSQDMKEHTVYASCIIYFDFLMNANKREKL